MSLCRLNKNYRVSNEIAHVGAPWLRNTSPAPRYSCYLTWYLRSGGDNHTHYYCVPIILKPHENILQYV